jgi:uncharacterized protein involved in exopolysaccharide biosynthesis
VNWSLFARCFLISAWAVKKVIALIFIVFALLAIVYVKLEAPKYKTSWIMLLPGTERSSTINLDNLGEARSSGTNAYGSVSISPKNTYKEIALSDAVISKAAQKMGVEAFTFSKPRIKLVDQTPAMLFSLKGASIEELKQKAVLYNDTFHSVLDTLRNNEIERHYQGVEGNLQEAKKRLTTARKAMVEYQSTSSIMSDTQFQTWLNDAEQLRTKQSQSQVDFELLKATLTSQLGQLDLSPEQAKAFLLLQANPAIQSALGLLSEKLAKRASMMKIYGSENPLRKQIEREILGIRKALANNLSSMPNLSNIQRPQLYGLLSKGMGQTLQSINDKTSKLEGTKAEILALTTQRELYEKRIKEHANEAAKLGDLKRNHQIAEAIFSSALTKLDTNRLDIYATYPLTQLLTIPGGNIKRDRLQAKLVVIALFLGFGLLSLALILTNLRKLLLEDAIENTTLNSSDEEA